jgi:hypothetical protein
LAPEVIQGVVRASFMQAKRCYTQGLAKDAALAGRVAARFVIENDGSVSSATSDPSSTMRDPSVVTCVVGVFKSLKFPPPQGGIVTVVYPLDFRPDSN